MGWFKDKDGIEERLTRLEGRVLGLTLERERREMRDREKYEREELPKEGDYIGEVVRMDKPQIVSQGWRVSFVVKVPGLPNYAHCGLLVDHRDAVDAMYAARDAYVGKTVRLKAKHRAVPARSATETCAPDGVRVVVAWHIESWEGINNEGC